jgi:hypothetical protein
MKKLAFLAAWICGFTSSVAAQNILIQTDKTEYKFDELVQLVYQTDFREDSIKFPAFSGLYRVSGPNTARSQSVKNGVAEMSNSWTYSLRLTQSGNIQIEGPIAYVNGQAIKVKPLIINVLPSNLTEEELADLKFDLFVENSLKPEGTLRYILNEEYGYIEVFKDFSWQFLRRLSEAELKKMARIK